MDFVIYGAVALVIVLAGVFGVRAMKKSAPEPVEDPKEKLARAAQIAASIGAHHRAAELFERAGLADEAARSHERAVSSEIKPADPIRPDEPPPEVAELPPAPEPEPEPAVAPVVIAQEAPAPLPRAPSLRHTPIPAPRAPSFTPIPVPPVRAASKPRPRVASNPGLNPEFLAPIEYIPDSSDLLLDQPVFIARSGPGPDALKRYIDGKSCSLQNIEVFHRLGLALLGNGRWIEALTAFDDVEAASPGYRDALSRADAIRTWQQELEGVRKQTRYSILGQLGRKGDSVVYRALDEVLRFDVALKVLPAALVDSPEGRHRFDREASAVAELNHPNLVAIHDFGVFAEHPYLAMEYVEGVTVVDLKDDARMSVIDSLRIAAQILTALDHAHQRSIFHRNLKPSNIMRTPTGLVKVMDFALAGAKSSAASYLAPEQIAGGTIDARTDVFAVGAMLYEMVTGQLPFDGVQRTKRPRPVSELNPELPNAISDLILRSIAIDPEDRFPNAHAFRSPLNAILSIVGDRKTADLRTADLPIPGGDLEPRHIAEDTNPPETDR
jgi:hypothetical protein